MELPPFTVVAEIVAHGEDRLTAIDLWRIAERASQLVGTDPHKLTNESSDRWREIDFSIWVSERGRSVGSSSQT
jgi:hypothetical protein